MIFEFLGNQKGILLLFNSVTLSQILIHTGAKRLILEIRNIGDLFHINCFKFLVGFSISIEIILKTAFRSKKRLHIGR
jgi:hypothetical protein